MTNEQQKAKELAKLLTAFADGKPLQYQMPIGYWVDYTNDATTEMICTTKYPIRIKPETKREPLTMQDLIERRKLGFEAMWICLISFPDTKYLINGIQPEGVWFGAERITYDELMNKYTFIDNSPCYKEVECE